MFEVSVSLPIVIEWYIPKPLFCTGFAFIIKILPYVLSVPSLTFIAFYDFCYLTELSLSSDSVILLYYVPI